MVNLSIAEFDYKGLHAEVNIGLRKIVVTKTENERLARELGAIAIGYADLYREHHEFPKFEEAKLFAAYFCMPLDILFPNHQPSAEELAERAGVTEEFAKFRIDLEKQKGTDASLDSRL